LLFQYVYLKMLVFMISAFIKSGGSGMLTENELKRYDRQIMIPGFGEEGQDKLKRAKVFIAGAGGLGSPIAIYLTAAGVGTIRIVDRDTVELSNLNRQILHWHKDIDRPKVLSAAEKLNGMNPDTKVEALRETITEDNAIDLIRGCDVILDAMDNLPTRYLLNKTAMALGIPFIHGAVMGFEGRAMTIIPGASACLMCVYRGATVKAGKFPVIGVAPAVIGCIEATEAIKYITGIGKLLTNKLLLYNGFDMKFMALEVKRNPDCGHCGQPAKEGKK
jgi:molybdopterin-synthase adenylyltransferase